MCPCFTKKCSLMGNWERPYSLEWHSTKACTSLFVSTQESFRTIPDFLGILLLWEGVRKNGKNNEEEQGSRGIKGWGALQWGSSLVPDLCQESHHLILFLWPWNKHRRLRRVPMVAQWRRKWVGIKAQVWDAPKCVNWSLLYTSILLADAEIMGREMAGWLRHWTGNSWKDVATLLWSVNNAHTGDGFC
jgi:hypothetical protein